MVVTVVRRQSSSRCRSSKQDEVAARILERFPDDQLIFTRDLPEIYATGVPALNVFIKVVVGVASAISVLVILLAMYTTVTERTRQIGILKSLGMSKAAIAWVIEQEAIFVSLMGVVVGVLLTYIARFAVMRVTSLTIDVEPRWVLISLRWDCLVEVSARCIPRCEPRGKMRLKR